MNERSSSQDSLERTEEPPTKRVKIEPISEEAETRDNLTSDKLENDEEAKHINETVGEQNEKIQKSKTVSSKVEQDKESNNQVLDPSITAQSEEVKSSISNAVAHAKAAIGAKISGVSSICASSESPLKVPTATEIPPESEKPARGSPAWQQLRKLNHKEVERRRRESINQAIKELRELLPTQNSNKSQTIKRAAEYIRRLRENENANIEKWTLEKLITDQAVNELANSNEKLKSELEKAYREIEIWKKHFLEIKAKLKDGKN
ncbi:hypothetical protein BRETT_001081 [Brettanomyces bruxellensis]|uniref:BHLH domain-containing protein n=1 Tax=Dekkera bruxellensis TaxID=5007 RepID=A0A871R657_DEKBR|nr:uncharacterized protein BRETT_001081 [Brettanomyces bruxellensis]QOU21359.1 hypothetical protein BRETT_001081 [Brettanomyces bruxellensis]